MYVQDVYFSVARNGKHWEESKCPSRGDEINKLWKMHAIVKWNKIQ